MEQKQVIDLDTIDLKRDAEAGFDVHLRHPQTDAPIGTIIRVMGSDSEAYQEKDREHQRERLERLARTGAVTPPTEEEKEHQAADLLAAVTVSWTDLIIRGKPQEFSKANALALYADSRRRWIREQVDAAVHRRANFLRQPAKA